MRFMWVLAAIAALMPATAVLAGGTLGLSRELPVGADYCAILRAFSNAPDPRCAPVDVGVARAVDLSAGQEFSKAAAPIEASGATPGYFIRFAFNSVALTAEYRAHLDRLSSVFRSQAMQGVCIKLLGHTDNVGNPDYNRRLSRARADVVAAYLRGVNAVAPGRLSSEGAGEAAPLKGLPGAHPLNRRVEILAKAATEKGCA